MGKKNSEHGHFSRSDRHIVPAEWSIESAMDACKRVLKKCSKKRDMLILKHSFYVLWYKNNFWNDYDLFDRLSSISSLLQINIFPSMYFLYLFGFFSSYPHSSKKDCGYLSSSFFIVPTESSTINDKQIQWESSLGGFLVGKSVLVLSLQDYQKLPPEVFYEKRHS